MKNTPSNYERDQIMSEPQLTSENQIRQKLFSLRCHAQMQKDDEVLLYLDPDFWKVEQ